MIYNERCTIVANPNGTIKTVFVDRMGVDDHGRHYAVDQVTIGSAELTQFLGDSHASDLKEMARLAQDLATVTPERDTLKEQLKSADEAANREIDKVMVLEGKVLELQAELTSIKAAKTLLESQVKSLTDGVQTQDELVKTLQAKVTFLNSIKTYNTRLVDGKAFYARISKDDMVKLMASNNPRLIEIGKTIVLYRDNSHQWPVDLDAPETQEMVNDLISAGLFDPSDVAVIMRDASREEAFEAS
jgi:hypothetical protein